MSKIGIDERSIIVATDVNAQKELAERVGRSTILPTLSIRTLAVVTQQPASNAPGIERTRLAHGLHSILGSSYIFPRHYIHTAGPLACLRPLCLGHTRNNTRALSGPISCAKQAAA
jgi:hypothetical protein